MLQTHFRPDQSNLSEILPKNHQNVQKTHFLQKVPGVNGLMYMYMYLHVSITKAFLISNKLGCKTDLVDVTYK